MPVLTAPTPRPVQIELPTISFFGRSLDEYVRFFDLDIDELRGRPVLDVAAGPSSFTAEACRRGIDAVAVDPLYGSTPATLATHVQLDYVRMFAQMRAKPRLFKLALSARSRAAGEPALGLRRAGVATPARRNPGAGSPAARLRELRPSLNSRGFARIWANIRT